MTPKALHKLLSGHPRLSEMNKVAQKQPLREENNPARVLPPALRERVTLVEDQQRWLAITDTSATAQLLRFHLPRLQQALPGQQIKIVVGGKRGQLSSQPPSQQGATLSQASAQHIADLAASIDDKELKEALQRLASRGQN